TLPDPHLDRVTQANLLRGPHSQIVQVHVTARDGFGSSGAGLEEPRRPQPLVDPHLLQPSSFPKQTGYDTATHSTLTAGMLPGPLGADLGRDRPLRHTRRYTGTVRAVRGHDASFG